MKKNSSVKMSLTRGQSAWVIKSPSETQRSAFSSGKLSNSIDFNNWLTGFVDGDGTFYFEKHSRNNSWNFSFQIQQSTYNLRVLYFVKTRLGVGSVSTSYKGKKSMGLYRLRDRQHIINIIIPIFDKHPPLTSKRYRAYKFFREAIFIADRSDLSVQTKNILISEIKAKLASPIAIPISREQKALFLANSQKSKESAMKVINKWWIVGFTEAEGSFYLYKKDKKRIAHAFEITQTNEPVLLKAIALILDLKFKIKNEKTNHATVLGEGIALVSSLIDYFSKHLKGMKSLEFRLWERSFNKRKRGFDYLLKIQAKMRKIRETQHKIKK
jgi:hypothetical protein